MHSAACTRHFPRWPRPISKQKAKGPWVAKSGRTATAFMWGTKRRPARFAKSLESHRSFTPFSLLPRRSQPACSRLGGRHVRLYTAPASLLFSRRHFATESKTFVICMVLTASVEPSQCGSCCRGKRFQESHHCHYASTTFEVETSRYVIIRPCCQACFLLVVELR